MTAYCSYIMSNGVSGLSLDMSTNMNMSQVQMVSLIFHNVKLSYKTKEQYTIDILATHTQ